MTLDSSVRQSHPTPAWDDGKWTSLPHLSGVVRADVCVVGLGGSGLSAIHALLDHGVNVVGIDGSRIAGGAAGANGGFLLAGTARFYHHTVEQLGRQRASELYRLTIDEIGRMHASMPDVVRLTGSLRIAMSEDESRDCEVQRAALQADGFPVELYDGQEGRGLIIPTDGVFNPLTRCRRLAQGALQRGARLYEYSVADEIQSGSVRTAHGIVRCNHVIVAVDGKLEKVFPELSGTVRTARLQMLGTAATEEVRVDRAVYARWGYEYWQQLPDGRVVLGGFRDAAMEAEWTCETDTSDAIQQRLERFLRERVGVLAPITHRWAASVGYTESGFPLLRELRKNVWVVGGYNGTGNVVGALCGQLAAQMSLGKTPSDAIGVLYDACVTNDCSRRSS